MAYASVALLLQTINLVNYHQDFSIFPQFKDQITSLHEHTSFLQSFLEDDDPNRAKNWQETIREVTDRAEEIIDLLISDSLLKSSAGSKSGLNYSFNELKKVTEEMESTAARVKSRSTKPNSGADAELKRLLFRLLEGSPARESIAIVGIPGMGKSTLARNAYNHPSVMEHFAVRASSIVSQEYSRIGVVLDLLRSLDIECASSSEFGLIETLHKTLRGRRYLIVLHDVCNMQVWDDLRCAFPNNGNGSRILIVSRLTSSAGVNAGHVHEMSLLDEGSSWNLLREKIFEGEPCPSRLEYVGKTIAGKCRGHRLSIEVVAGILAADQTEAAWEDVLENMSVVSDDDLEFLEMLYLSYEYLPHYLRPCLLYLGCFAKDVEIRVSKLIRLWLAEGFLNGSGSKSFQEIGEEGVDGLARRGLVSIHSRKSNGGIKSIMVHALVRDFALDVGRFPWIRARRVSSSNCGHDFLEGVHDSTIRTIILHSINQGFTLSLGNIRLLRILDLSNAYYYELPEEVFELFHLRYLAFDCMFSISEAISNLQNLQTLIIYVGENVQEFGMFPEGIWSMQQLRHLSIPSFKLPGLEGENFALENLETLSTLVDFVCSIQNLKMIPNVKKLNLFYTGSFEDVVEEIELHNLIFLHKLEILTIEMEFCFRKRQKMSSDLPPTLRKLDLWGLRLPWEDMKMVASLPNLEVLKLGGYACFDERWETSEGGFSRLEYLLIEVSNLKLWMTGSSHFPRLKRLVLRSCLDLSKVPYEIGEIPTLQLIELDGKNQSLLNSAKQIQEDRLSLGDYGLQILVLV